MKVLIHEPVEIQTGKQVRKVCRVACPDCGKEKDMRYDSFKKAATTRCRSCSNRARPKKDPEDLFNHKKFYRTPKGKAIAIYKQQVQKSKERGHPAPEYSQDELVNFLLNSPTYLKLFKEWEASDFNRWKAPSCDRLDDYKGYSFENIQIVDWTTNDANYSEAALTGKNTKTCKAVIQKTLNGKQLNTFYSQQQAMRKTGIPSWKISKCCLGRLKQAGGYLWEFV